MARITAVYNDILPNAEFSMMKKMDHAKIIESKIVIMISGVMNSPFAICIKIVNR